MRMYSCVGEWEEVVVPSFINNTHKSREYLPHILGQADFVSQVHLELTLFPEYAHPRQKKSVRELQLDHRDHNTDRLLEYSELQLAVVSGGLYTGQFSMQIGGANESLHLTDAQLKLLRSSELGDVTMNCRLND